VISLLRNHTTFKYFRAAALAMLLFSILAAAFAQPDPPPAGVTVQLNATPLKATVGDPIQLEVDVTTPPGHRVEILKPGIQTGDFSILDFSPASKMVEQKDKLPHHKARIVVAIFKTGSFIFPPIRIILEDSSGKKTVVSSPSTTIEIQSILDKNAKLKDLKKQADMPEKFNWALWLGIVLAGCILGFLLWKFLKRRRDPPVIANTTPVKNPLEVAESDLRSLLSQGLPPGGMEKKFYILLSDIVKRILESGFGIRTEEQTTSEIMVSIRRVSNLDIEKLELIETFLSSCDVVKFAKYIPSKSEHEVAGKRALEVLAAAKAVVSRQSSVVSR
jgi:hypothetical protein